jgi:hypothetical protein
VVFTFDPRLLFTFGSDILPGWPLWAGCGGCVVPGCVFRAVSGRGRMLWDAWAAVMPVLVRVDRRCDGGMPAVARSVRVLRRRRRVFGGRPAAARRALSSWRASQAVRMRWLRTVPVVLIDELDDAHVGGEADHRASRLAVPGQPLGRGELADRRHFERVTDRDPVVLGQRLAYRRDRARGDPQPASPLFASEQDQRGGVHEQRLRLCLVQPPYDLPGREGRRDRGHVHRVAHGRPRRRSRWHGPARRRRRW